MNDHPGWDKVMATRPQAGGFALLAELTNALAAARAEMTDKFHQVHDEAVRHRMRERDQHDAR